MTTISPPVDPALQLFDALVNLKASVKTVVRAGELTSAAAGTLSQQIIEVHDKAVDADSQIADLVSTNSPSSAFGVHRYSVSKVTTGHPLWRIEVKRVSSILTQDELRAVRNDAEKSLARATGQVPFQSPTPVSDLVKKSGLMRGSVNGFSAHRKRRRDVRKQFGAELVWIDACAILAADAVKTLNSNQLDVSARLFIFSHAVSLGHVVRHFNRSGITRFWG